MNQKELETKIRGLYKSSDEVKSALESEFGKEFFTLDISERINGWEDMMEETGRPDAPVFVDLPEDLRDHFRKYYRVVIMNEAYNEGERMDIYDSSKARHYPYFLTNGSPSAFAFRGSIFDSTNAHAGSGSRLALKSAKRVEIAATKHPEIYREWLES
ncbi:hypothetical protein [Dysgonomonas sp. BGC7]|uniref:hypothetical protein n=1 Tax=Dysgonomonas sp. BGC7 TaxID=1658008 RepID=UPI00067FF490|nr:hypothetical protein [Dysgonomonas sp. BGC7]MBD8389631.1 hypothetical protein [Dysgonomonas sp. BGC7]